MELGGFDIASGERRMSEGMQSAVANLYKDHGSRALRLAYLLSGDLATAEDLVQDAFVRLLGRLRSIRDPHALNAYLGRTIVNLAKNHHRRGSRVKAHLDSASGARPAITSMPDFEGRDELCAQLLRLPYRQRVALVMRYCEDLPEAEVATLLGTSPKAVRSLVGRGLATLRESNGRNGDG
jgi:RNA polymerase sigma-70 factor (sigma-E family)